jgi:hypothetical protein
LNDAATQDGGCSAIAIGKVDMKTADFGPLFFLTAMDGRNAGPPAFRTPADTSHIKCTNGVTAAGAAVGSAPAAC